MARDKFHYNARRALEKDGWTITHKRYNNTMDKVVKYRQLIKDLLTNYASPNTDSNNDIEEQLVFDAERDHYQLLSVGWQNKKRIYFCLLHLDIKNNKIWLQENSTDYDIVEDLIKSGVPNSDVVIGFHPADVRKLTDFAVA